jgi:hypothetical protein
MKRSKRVSRRIFFRHIIFTQVSVPWIWRSYMTILFASLNREESEVKRENKAEKDTQGRETERGRVDKEIERCGYLGVMTATAESPLSYGI